MTTEWQDEDVVTTTYATVKLSAQQNFDKGWQEAIQMVLSVVIDMQNSGDFDNLTLDELAQRIV